MGFCELLGRDTTSDLKLYARLLINNMDNLRIANVVVLGLFDIYIIRGTGKAGDLTDRAGARGPNVS